MKLDERLTQIDRLTDEEHAIIEKYCGSDTLEEFMSIYDLIDLILQTDDDKERHERIMGLPVGVDDAMAQGLRARLGITMTKEQALRAIAEHGVTIEDILAVMPRTRDKTHPHYEDRDILKIARKAGSSLTEVLRDARENGGSTFEVDLIGWIEKYVSEPRKTHS
jgi:hypothetical protein